jgi:hypothetical protein
MKLKATMSKASHGSHRRGQSDRSFVDMQRSTMKERPKHLLVTTRGRSALEMANFRSGKPWAGILEGFTAVDEENEETRRTR